MYWYLISRVYIPIVWYFFIKITQNINENQVEEKIYSHKHRNQLKTELRDI